MNVLQVATKIVSNPYASLIVCSTISGFLWGRIEIANDIEKYLEDYS